jgi:hypothetical protein
MPVGESYKLVDPQAAPSAETGELADGVFKSISAGKIGRKRKTVLHESFGYEKETDFEGHGLSSDTSRRFCPYSHRSWHI